jgi:hypothetical protein
MFPRAAGRDNSDDICAPRKHDSDQSVFRRTYSYRALLIISIRAAKNDWSVKNFDSTVEIDSVFSEI